MILFSGLFYMVGINLLGMIVCYSLEVMSRRDFMLNEMLKIAENEAREINAHLEQMVSSRTAALTRTNRELEVSVRREKDLVVKLKAEEAKLQKSLASLQQAESIARLGYFERNWQTGEGYWSTGFRRLLGLGGDSDALSHTDFLAFVHPADRERVAGHIRSSLARHEPMDIAFRIVAKDDNVKFIQGVADTSYDSRGEPLMTRGIFQDVTDRKEAEDALEMLQRQLIQAQKIESLGRLAGGVAHDYNNMLNVIIGYTEMALEEVGPDTPLHTDLVEILNAAKRSAAITNQLLAFARRQTIAPEVLDLNATIEGMLKMLRRLIGEDIDLAWLPETTLWPVKMDPSQVDQILVNLCVNSRDAITAVGKITIETENAVFEQAYCADHAGFAPGDFVMLAVSDDGCGMNKEVLANIFEPFFTTKKLGEGTGLGLATVFGIVKQNEGFINVYSESGRGTTIKIYLPRYTGAAPAEKERETLAAPRGRGETVLVVEDEPSILKLAENLLLKLGYTVLTAESPDRAISLAGSGDAKIDLLITDVVMPEMSGRELEKKLRELYPEIECIFMSGYTANVIAHRGILDDDVNFIQKPFSKKDLAVIVRRVLDQKMATGASPIDVGRA